MPSQDRGPDDGGPATPADGAVDARWFRLEPVLDELLELSAEGRESALRDLAERDAGLAAEARRLLAAADADGLPGRPAAELAAVLGDDDERAEGDFEQEVAIEVVKGGLDSEEVMPGSPVAWPSGRAPSRTS
jgi:hypothetical protein